MSVALYMDENVHAAITNGLRSRGVDVVTVQDDGQAGAPDPVILDRALSLGRVLFTHDQDFLTEAALRQASGVPFAGVVYAHQASVSIGTCVSDLELIAQIDNPEDHANRSPTCPCEPMRAAIPLLMLVTASAPGADPVLVGHRGLPTHAPEETLATFNACIDLRVGVELDVRRTRDGQLVCLHDPTLDRTTDGKGKLAALSFRELRQLDAGKKFDPAFAGERVPALEEFFSLLKERNATSLLVAIDLKEPDCEAEVVKLAEKYGVLKQLAFIGLAIESAPVRAKLKDASAAAACAALCPAADKLTAAIDDKSADWVYVRFIPSAEEVKKVHAAGKRVFLVGPLVMGNEPENWATARAAGVDAMLTDYPLECRTGWRAKK